MPLLDSWSVPTHAETILAHEVTIVESPCGTGDVVRDNVATWGVGHVREGAVPRLLPRKAQKRAAVIVAHAPSIMAYPVLTPHEPHHDMEVNFFDKRDLQAVERGPGHRRAALGCTVSLQLSGSVV